MSVNLSTPTDKPPGRLDALLRLLAGPALPTTEIARRLGAPIGVLQDMLVTLVRGGYLELSGSRQTGQCGACALKSLCITPSDCTSPNWLTLTPKGAARAGGR